MLCKHVKSACSILLTMPRARLLHFPRSTCHQASVDGQNAAGCPARFVRNKIDCSLRDFLRLPQATHWMKPFEPGLDLRICEYIGGPWGNYSGWADTVTADVPFCIGHGHGLCQHHKTCFGRLIGMGFK